MQNHLHVIHLRFERAQEMFELPHGTVFSEHRNFLTGVDYCLSDLRSRPAPNNVRVEIELPASEVDGNTQQRIEWTLRRYCRQLAAYNSRERRAVRLDGASSLGVGLLVTFVGLVIVLVGAGVLGTTSNTAVVLDTMGSVLVWVGLWFPLDTMLFTPLIYRRTNRVLELLHEAEVVVTATAALGPEPIPAGSARTQPQMRPSSSARLEATTADARDFTNADFGFGPKKAYRLNLRNLRRRGRRLPPTTSS